MDQISKFKLGQDSSIQEFIAYTSRRSHGIKTGLPSFDGALLGLQGLVALVGQPKSCKSTLALQIAFENANAGVPVFYVDRENGWLNMLQRLICHKNMLSERGLRLRPVSNRIALVKELEALPFYLCSSPFDQQTFEGYIEQMIGLYPDSPNVLFIVDSLHKIPGLDYGNIGASLDTWLVFLDQLANKYQPKLTTVLICEKNRASYGEASGKSGKDTGRIEFTAHQQFDVFVQEKDPSAAISVKCIYNRYGDSGQTFRLEKVFAGGPKDFVYKLKEFSSNHDDLELE